MTARPVMLGLSRQTVRQSWPPYVGAFVALTCGVVLIAMAVSLAGAVDVSSRRPGVTAAERAQLDDLASMIGVMSGVALFMAMFVVASTFGFVVAARQRELGLLRLVGATPRQVRTMVLGESAVVAVLATVAGSLLATVVTPVFVALLEAQGLLAVDLTMPAPWIAWSVAAGCGAGVALLGSWRASKRAARVAPVAAFREAGLERRRPSVVQIVVGTVCLVGPVAVFFVADEISPLFALVTGILLPEVVVIGLVCFGRLLFPWLSGLLARPFARRDIAARLAGDHVRTGARTPAALAAPILAISAIAGSMIVTLSFTADWTTALDRVQLHVPVVVETGGDRAVVSRLVADPDVVLADPRIVVGEHEVIDVRLAERSRGLAAVRGSLDDLGDDRVAVTETYAMDAGVGIGDPIRIRVDGEPVRPRVAAVVGDAPDLYAEVLVPPALGGAKAGRVVPDVVFVDPGSADLDAVLAGTGAIVLGADAWIDQVDAQTRAGNQVGLWVLLGPAGLYAAIAIVNAVLVGVSQRRRQLRTVGLLGATGDQLRRMVIWEAGLVGAAALLLGALVTGFVAWLIRYATTRDVPDVPMTVPWLPLVAIVATCLGLAVVAALAGARAAVRASA
ncbi:FtsX-like permease family protein [Nocardioides soli]|uniref:Putative ABC transport system permease protein n=1 Tax=Nocardioides soli TaxID=1036020 RepID=A0A7W4W0D2_9ACTN|nr:ABC transporter permease [Nocardioides soli]MBB3045128.1 putative ABC transport system permease protein [Nocardioides soli]